MSFYQKYRPQNFSDLLGQQATVDTLVAQLRGDKTVQAYLFIGHKGTGKTTTARLLAKSLNCEALQDGEPCGKCVSCVAVTNGSHLDVLEIDAASNRGIEEIRDLREKIKLAPTQGKMKVYIIDEVHMLTTEAFNALLKTLEEPPASVVFVLCTTDAHKVPATILSRCQRFEFTQASGEDLAKLVEKTAKKESLKVDRESVAAIAGSSDGSYRDALTLLEQLGVSGEVTVENLQRVTHAGKEIELAELVEKEETLGALKVVGELQASGVNLTRLNESMLRGWREKLLEAVEAKDAIGQTRLVKLLQIFSRAQGEMKSAVLPTLPLELAILEATSMVAPKALVARSASLTKLNGSEDEVIEVAVANEKVASRGAAAENGKGKALAGREEAAEKVEPVGSPEDLQALKDSWDKLLKALKPLNHSLEAFLRGCEANDVASRTVTLKFFYKFHKDMVDQPKNRKLVEEELGKLLGRDVKLKTVLGEKPQSRRIKFEEVQNVEEVPAEDLAQKAVDIFNSGIS